MARAQLPPASLPLPPAFLDTILDAAGTSVTFPLPNGQVAVGSVVRVERDAAGVLRVQGPLTAPQPGHYFFQRQTVPGKAGPLVGVVHFDVGEVAYRVEPLGVGGTPVLVQRHVDQVICRHMPRPPAQEASPPGESEPQHSAESHPDNIPIPAYQNGIIPLSSLPGAIGVIYLDFTPSGASNAEIKEVWQGVAEDFAPFNLNITTDRKVFDEAPEGSRQRIILSPSEGGGGLAYIGSYNWSGDAPGYSGSVRGKAAVEVVSHEIGHTLGLYHDGRTDPPEEYYNGHGTAFVGPYEQTSWSPIMGAGYYTNLSQWSKGEYLNANNQQDDLFVITNYNNNVDYRADDVGDSLGTAAYLEILPDNTVSNEGIIGTGDDVDAFRFTTTAAGVVNLNVSPVSFGPNLDILAELYTSDGQLVTSSNPDQLLDAAIATTLPAGEYTLRISGVGRGSPTEDGYSDYGSLGAYFISGTVIGGVKPDRFTLAEDSAAGTAVGTVAPRGTHAGALTYSFSSGNETNAFAIDPATGAITVADAAQMDFETRSTRWDDPATFDLLVHIDDSANPGANETIRAVVTLTNVNEPPVISGAGTLTMFEHTRPGTFLRQLSATDPDQFDFPSAFAIVAGNTGGAFAIDATGKITAAADMESDTQSVYHLTVQVTDQGNPPATATATVTINVLPVPDGYAPGAIVRTFFEGIGGTQVANLTTHSNFPDRPDSQEFLPNFEGGGHGDNYGSTVRGWLLAPATGDYTFWIASDDNSELRLSTGPSQAGAQIIASVPDYTYWREWTKFPTQRSLPVTLQAGQAYYIEARQKEGGGGDHVGVAWEGPGFSQQVIPGLYLAPFYQNYAPLPAATFTVRRDAFNGTPVGTVRPADVNSQDSHHSFAITGGTGAGVFGIDPGTGRVFVTNRNALDPEVTPSYTLEVSATDTGTPPMTGTGTVTINVADATGIQLAGILQEIWDDIGGSAVSALTGDPRYPLSPSRTRTLTNFDTGGDIADHYGTRIRAWLVPPTTGSYTFYLAGDDDCQLRLSSDDTATNATQIASVTGYTARSEWNKFPSQPSAPITLVAGRRYYIETLLKEDIGGDFVQVAWTGPDIPTITVLPDSVLEPYDANRAPTFAPATYSFSVSESAANGALVGTVSATDPDLDSVAYAILGGNPGGGTFAIHPLTGAITVADPAALAADQTIALQIGAQDDGHGAFYPLRSAVTTATIVVEQSLARVSPPASNVNVPSGVGVLLEAGNGGRAGSTIAWSKVSGPGAVVFETPAALATGTAFAAPGIYVLRCSETRTGNTTFFDTTVNVGFVDHRFAASKVGAQAVEPSHGVNGSAYEISAAGAGIPAISLADDFYFLNLPAAGNVVIAARIVSVQNVAGASSRAGVAIRESLAADARQLFCGVDSTGGGHFTARSTAGLFNTDTTAAAGQPYWVRLARSGNEFTASFAPDNAGVPGAWSAAGAPVSISMGANVFVGLAAASGSTSAAGTAVIDRVTITPSPVNVGALVGAGPDGSSQSVSNVALDGSVLDDGLPNPPAAVTTAWSTASGPGAVAFADPALTDTNASFPAGGAYILRLTADDGQVKTFDDTLVEIARPTITLTLADPTASERGPTTGSFSIARTGPVTTELVVNYAISGSATNGTDYTTIATSVTIPAGAATATVTITPISDTLAEGPETVTLTVATNAAYDIGALSTGTVTIADVPADAWRFARFGADANNSAIAGDLADPNDNGLVNLLEYAFDLDPLGSELSAYPLLTKEGSNVTFTYRRNLAATDLSYTIESTEEGDAWTPVTPASEQMLLDDGSTHLIKAVIPVGDAQRMMLRLKIVRQ